MRADFIADASPLIDNIGQDKVTRRKDNMAVNERKEIYIDAQS
jgi:hypothetical protein